MKLLKKVELSLELSEEEAKRLMNLLSNILYGSRKINGEWEQVSNIIYTVQDNKEGIDIKDISFFKELRDVLSKVYE